MPSDSVSLSNSLSGNELLIVEQARCRLSQGKMLTIDSLRIEVGQHVCIYGQNGAGKSLLANLILGERIESKRFVKYHPGFDPKRDILVVSFEEQQRLWQRDDRFDISEFSEAAEDKGTLVLDLITGGEAERTVSADLQSVAGEKRRTLAHLLATLGLEELLHKGIRFLSSGQIRKVLIARALYAKSSLHPQLLVLDDPLESIDHESRLQIKQCLQSWMDQGNASLLLCRRKQDILPPITHLALMHELALIEFGALDRVAAGENFDSISNYQLPETISLPNPVSHEKPQLGKLPACYIELRNVAASYGDLAVLQQLNWRMMSHHHTLIEGPNGCGKSTLLSLIDGDNHKAYGQDVTLFGRRRGSGETVWDVKSHFGVVSNDLHHKYVKGWRVLDVVVSGFYDTVGLYDDAGSIEKTAACEWLATLGIESLENNFYKELSFGQQRLVLLARAMVKHPDILILDEPCVGLDDFHRQMFLQTLDKIAIQTRTQIIYVSHVLDEKPQCINQRLTFKRANNAGKNALPGGGVFTVTVQEI